MSCKNCEKKPPSEMRFQKCERGFLVSAGRDYDGIKPLYAFENIGDLAQWLVDNFDDVAR